MNIAEFNKNIVSKDPGNIFLFFGEEVFLMDECLKYAKNTLIPRETSEFNYFTFEEKSLNRESILAAIEGFPQMSEHKMIVIKYANIFQAGGLGVFLEKLLLDVPKDTHVFILEKTVDRRKKLLSLIEQKGGVIEFSIRKNNELVSWLNKKFEQEGKNVDPQIISYIILNCGRYMYRLEQEFKKLISYITDKDTVTQNDLDNILSKNIEVRVFDILDLIVYNNKIKVFELIDSFKENREQPTAILGIMGSLIGELLMLKQLESNAEVGEYFEPNRKFLIPKLSKQSRFFGENFLRIGVEKCLDYDMKIKRGAINPWIAVQMFAAFLVERY